MMQINHWAASKFGGLISQCHTMGAEAHTLAAKGSDEKRAQYLLLAAAWADLARDMRRASIDSPGNAE